MHTWSKAPEAREEIATVLFLDIVGFSTASQQRTPVEAFRELKTVFDRITRLVHEYGGTVDRSLGDGLLAYFVEGDKAKHPGSHADRAMACGAAILWAQVDGMLAAAEQPGAFVLPVRIGINSGQVYLGDLGNDDRRDDTIIGAAVNFGQRLEAACEMNRIMVGEETMALATLFSEITPGLRRRPIIAKSYHDPVNAYEYDPLEGHEAARRAITAYRNFAQVQRGDERVGCDGAAMVMATNYGFATVLNASRSGFLLRLENYIARGATIHVEEVTAGMEHVPLPQLAVEVRWGAAQDDGTYLHGCLIKNFSSEQKAELWEQVSAAVGAGQRQRLV